MKITITIPATSITILDDGQFRYPVLTSQHAAWVQANGEITARNYEAFCDAVDCLGAAEHGTPGSQGMIDYCERLLAAGAEYVRLG